MSHAIVRVVSAARVDGPHRLTSLTRHFTAPPEHTVTVDLLQDLASLVPSPAAEKLAAVHSRRRRVTLPPLRAQRPRLPVGSAEVRRLFRVDEVRAARRLDGGALGDEAAAVVAGDDLGCAVEALLESVPDVAEGRHLAPARAEGAGAGQSVALTLGPHEVLYRLQQ